MNNVIDLNGQDYRAVTVPGSTRHKLSEAELAGFARTFGGPVSSHTIPGAARTHNFGQHSSEATLELK